MAIESLVKKKYFLTSEQSVRVNIIPFSTIAMERFLYFFNDLRDAKRWRNSRKKKLSRLRMHLSYVPSHNPWQIGTFPHSLHNILLIHAATLDAQFAKNYLFNVGAKLRFQRLTPST
jgi:hypothetical protein